VKQERERERSFENFDIVTILTVPITFVNIQDLW